MDTANYILIGVTALVFVATEWFYPIERTDEFGRKQKHFWSICITLTTLVVGFMVKNTTQIHIELHSVEAKLHERIAKVGAVFENLGDDEMEKHFQEIYSEYHKHFQHGSDLLHTWALGAVKQLKNDMHEGKITFPRESAAQAISYVYPEASKSIIASNVGGTGFYLTNIGYVTMNQRVLRDGIPLVRFYIWGKGKEIVTSESKDPHAPTKDAFFKEVKKLHEKLGTLYSVLIDIGKMRGVEAKDMLLVDNKFLAETELDESWLAISVSGTERPESVNDAKDYFRKLAGSRDVKYVVGVDDEKIKVFFPKWHNTKDKAGETLAERMFNDIMDQMTDG